MNDKTRSVLVGTRSNMSDTAPPVDLSIDDTELVVRNPRVCGGDAVLAGTRIAVHDLIAYVEFAHGDLDEVQLDFPHLTREQIQAAVDYYCAHEPEMKALREARRRDYDEGVARQRASG
jgi:uncharacterized protein (DUF433 family)